MGGRARLELVAGTNIAVGEKGENADVTGKGPPGRFSKPLASLHGIIFNSGPNPAAAPIVCRVFDINANVIIASAVTLEGDKVNVTTPNGVKFELARASLAKLDYSGGKLVYLSDLYRDLKKRKVT